MSISLRGYQAIGVENVIACFQTGVKRVLEVLPTGAGKCLGLGTRVLRFDGSTCAVEEIAVGDLLMGPDSKPRRVLSTTRGRGAMYRIVPIKGEVWTCNDVHVLTLVHTTTSKVIDVDLQTYLDESKTFRHCHKQFAPAGGVDFSLAAEPLPIDPYFLGVWYGDGTKRLNGVGITKPDQEIRVDGTSIPHAYLTAARPDRESMLAGLLDSDGYLQNGGFEIVQKNRGIADGVCFLARSLGKRALIGPKVVDGETYWRVSLSGDFTDLPMRIARKKPSRRLQKKCATRTGFSVEPIGDGDYAGFELDGDGRFLLGDFTVTHNTVLAVAIVQAVIRLYGCGVLFIAHRRELVKQAFCKAVRDGLDPFDIGIVMAGIPLRASRVVTVAVPELLDDDELWAQCARRDPAARVQFASIDTFRTKLRPLPRSEENPSGIGLVVIDEAHRSLAKSYVDVTEFYAGQFILGLTATPFRTDGQGMEEAFDQIVEVATYADLVEGGKFAIDEHGRPVPGGFLVPAWAYGTDKKPDLSKVKKSQGDYDNAQLAERVDKVELIGDIVDHWKRCGENAATIAFAVNVAHSKNICERFLAAGIAAVHVDGTTKTPEREAALRGLANGSVKVFCNCDVATEGVDVPAVKTIILGRPTMSERVYRQQAGRGSRPYKGQSFVILDHAGCCSTFGLPQWPYEVSLQGREQRGPGLPPAKECQDCFAIVASATKVCACGYIFPAATYSEPESIQEKPGELILLNDVQQERLDVWDNLVNEWTWDNVIRKAHGDKLCPPEWCKGEWRRRTHIEWPPLGSKIPKWSDEEKVYQQTATLRATGRELLERARRRMMG